MAAGVGANPECDSEGNFPFETSVLLLPGAVREIPMPPFVSFSVFFSRELLGTGLYGKFGCFLRGGWSV